MHQQRKEEEDLFDDISNPLDSVEDIMISNEWVFNRMNEDELTVQISGTMGEYTMFFVWQEDYSALQFCCQYDLNIPEERMNCAAKSLSEINSNLWLGHFDIRQRTRMPGFRHAVLFRGMTGTSGSEHIEDLVDVAMVECERYYPVFDLLTRKKPQQDDDLKLAMMDVAGQS